MIATKEKISVKLIGIHHGDWYAYVQEHISKDLPTYKNKETYFYSVTAEEYDKFLALKLELVKKGVTIIITRGE